MGNDCKLNGAGRKGSKVETGIDGDALKFEETKRMFKKFKETMESPVVKIPRSQAESMAAQGSAGSRDS